jgi:hypothetical protein
MPLPANILEVEYKDLPTWVREGSGKEGKIGRLSLALDRLAGYRGPELVQLLRELDLVENELFPPEKA